MNNNTALIRPAHGANFAYPFPCAAPSETVAGSNGPAIFERPQPSEKTSAEPNDWSTWWTSVSAPS